MYPADALPACNGRRVVQHGLVSDSATATRADPARFRSESQHRRAGADADQQGPEALNGSFGACEIDSIYGI